MCFKAMKSSGFDIEKTHLKEIDRLEKLLLLVMIAFVWCYKVGIFLHSKTPIEVKTHGRKAKSIFKLGLDYLASCFLNAKKQIDVPIFKFLSCTLPFLITSKSSKYYLLTQIKYILCCLSSIYNVLYKC